MSCFQSGYREGLTEGSESDDALQTSFDAGYKASFDPFKRLGAIRGSLVVALLNSVESDELKRLLEEANKMHCDMVADLKKESTVENVQGLVNNFKLKAFAQTFQESIAQNANKFDS